MRNFDLRDIEFLNDSSPFEKLSRVDDLYLASKIENFEQIDYLKGLNIDLAIDLKNKEETLFDDKAAFKGTGIEYINYPISSISSLSFEDLQNFSKLLCKTEGNKLIYCMSSNRVGALLALELSCIFGHPKQRAYEFGCKVGLVNPTTQDQVKDILFNNQGISI